MRRWLSLVAALALTTSAVAEQPRVTPLDSQAAGLDSLMKREMQARSIPGAVIGIVYDGKPVFGRAYGFANLETDTPMTTRSIFEIASLTKQFTAAAIMMLVEEEKLRLDDLLSTYIEGTPPGWQRITIRHLLTHTSGLDISAMPRLKESAPLSISRKQALEFILREPMFTATGRTGWYSDAGYVLLGLVIEKVSGRTYREFITERIFVPLQMSSSSPRDKARVLKGRVDTYGLRDGEIVNWRRESDYEVPAAFGIHSTIGDLARWDAALRRAVVLKPSSLQQMWTPGKLDNGEYAHVFMHRYGFGWELANLRGHPTVEHGGASGTYILRFIDEPLTVIVLTNLESQDRHPRTLSRLIAGTVRREYQAPDTLRPQTDPDPELTRAFQSMLIDVGNRRPSALMSERYATWFKASIGAQAVIAKQLGGASNLQYLAHDDLRGRSLWEGEPVSRLVHYSADVRGQVYILSVGITLERKIAWFEFQGRWAK